MLREIAVMDAQQFYLWKLDDVLHQEACLATADSKSVNGTCRDP